MRSQRMQRARFLKDRSIQELFLGDKVVLTILCVFACWDWNQVDFAAESE